jgi:hypothetical protein
VNDTSIQQLKDELQAITSALQEKEQLLQKARQLSQKQSKKSDIGWFLSNFTDEIGTIMAVLSGQKARKWDDVVRYLEQEIVLLKVDQKLKERDLETALKQNTSPGSSSL